MVKIAERLVIVETNLKNIKDTIDKLDKKFDKFMDAFNIQSKTCNSTFATKFELKDVRKSIILKAQVNRSWVQWLPSAMMVVFIILQIFITMK